ncbi:hypothetical protein LJR039_007518 [Pseudorhodoferax sp. LjRoot39]|uniref:hypothetical protein n=1 Tax=Pseudorhodoferax sp. LjRoot39 TaxID=3342328 RepID=UPI003ED0854B
MKLKELQNFIAVATTGNIAAAARQQALRRSGRNDLRRQQERERYGHTSIRGNHMNLDVPSDPGRRLLARATAGEQMTGSIINISSDAGPRATSSRQISD